MIKNRSARVALLVLTGLASLGLVAGAAPATAKKKKRKAVTRTATFNQCVDTAAPIANPDPVTGNRTAASAVVPVSVPKFKGKPQDGLVTAFNSLGVRITHTFDEDFDVFAFSPSGKAVAISDNADETNGGDGWGSGAANCTGSLVTLGDAFPTSIQTPGNTGVNTPITGSFKPMQPPSTFVGGPARGNWSLVVIDETVGDTGAINAVSLNFTYQYKAPVKKKKKGKK
jgi:subtilisin-like proprotein convertase family protein